MQPDHVPESVDCVVQDEHLVSQIVACLATPQDRLSASLVCKLWNEAVRCRLQRVAVRSRVLLRSVLHRFACAKELDLGRCCDKLQDADLINVKPFLSRIESMFFGHPDNPQNRVSDDSFMTLAVNMHSLKHIELSSFSNITDKSIVALVRHCRQLSRIHLEDCFNLGDAAVEAISRLPNLQELSLKGDFGFTSRGLSVIGERCAALHTVCFELRNIDVGFALKSIATGCPRIAECSLRVDSVDLADIAKCTTLTCLRVETNVWNRLDEAVVAIAVANKNLQELTIVNHDEPLSDMAVVRVIQSCPFLVKLHVYAARLSDMVLQCLMGCKSLKSLTLDHFSNPGGGLAEIGLCGLDLKCLSLRSGQSFRDVELQTVVQGSQWLELLDLQCCHGLSPIGFSAISQCVNLNCLNLSFTEVDNVSLMSIANGIKGLKQLSLVKCESISDMGILARFSALEVLNLDQCPFVNDEGLAYIGSCCSRLTHLSLAFTQISDKGLFNLTQCSHLQSLIIPYCGNVLGGGVVAISKACAWLHFVVLSHRFRGTKILKELNNQFCMARLEADDMALVPFGFNLLM